VARKEKNNFKQAMNELLGAPAEKRDEKGGQEYTEEKMVEELPVIQEIEIEHNEPVAKVQEKRDEAIISADMVITGNISTKSNMKIMGSIVGDVLCEGDVWLYGNVQGNICSSNLAILSGSLTGDAKVEGNLSIAQGSVLVGNINAKNVLSNARIEGQICVTETIELKEDALVQGDIFAGTISIKSGAKVKGMVTISE